MRALSEATTENRSLLLAATGRLKAAGVHRAQWTAEHLLSHHLECHPVHLYTENPVVMEEQKKSFLTSVAARAGGMPLQYVMQFSDFYGRDFSVGPGVFIPRPETEVLVEEGLTILKSLCEESEGIPTVVDVGTGSGIIAITLRCELPGLKMCAVDSSEPALRFARRNADLYGQEITFLQGDLLEPVETQSVDLIISNPPYLDPQEAGQWPTELSWEPWLALDGGEQGSAVLKKLIGQAHRVLMPQGRILLEIGLGQVESLKNFLKSQPFAIEFIRDDLVGRQRVVCLQMTDPWKN